MRILRKRVLELVICIVLTIVTSGCGLAPKEEILPDAPVLPTGSVQEYKKVEVMRGDIIDKVTISCTYQALQTEKLNFAQNGLRISHVYVKEGDFVNAGDILADLEMKDITQQLEDHTDNIELLNLKLSNAKELKNLSVSLKDKLQSINGYNEQIDNQYLNEITNYETAVSDLKDELYLEQKRISRLQEEIKECQLVTDINGVISYVADYRDGDISNSDTDFINVYNPDSMAFTADGKISELFYTGQKITILAAGVEYPATVLAPGSLDFQDNAEVGTNLIYLQVEDKEHRLQIGTQGEITFPLQELQDVLYLPEGAVHEEDGKPIVYIEDASGFKSIKEVKTGLRAGRKVEILSGLKEGDSVILD